MTAVNTGNLFSTLTDAMRDLDGAFSGIYKDPGLAKDLKAAAEEMRSELTSLEQVPANIWFENGAKTIQVAVPGKTKENIKVSLTSNKGQRLLQIDANAPELTDEEKEAIAKRDYRLKKIRGMTALTFKVPVEDGLDVKSLKAKVENGLLTITIAPIPEEQPFEFNIE